MLQRRLFSKSLFTGVEGVQRRQVPRISKRLCFARAGVRLGLAVALLFNLLLLSQPAHSVQAAPQTQDPELVSYTHPDGLFELERPVLLRDEELVPESDVLDLFNWAEAGMILGFADPQDVNSALAVVFLDTGAPFEDYFDWEAQVDRMLETFAGERLSYLQVDTDEETLYTRMVVRNREDVIFTLTAYGEGSLLAMAVGASFDDWDVLEDSLHAGVESFVWDAEAVAAYLGQEEASPPSLPDPTPTPSPEPEEDELPTDAYTAPDGIYTLVAPPGYEERERDIVGPEEVVEVFPGFEFALISALMDEEDVLEENVIGFFFLVPSEELGLDDPQVWSAVAELVTEVILWDAIAVETILDDPQSQFLRLLVENDDATFFADVYGDVNGDDELVILAVAGGADWPALEETMRAALDTFTWDRAAVFDALDVEVPGVVIPEPEVVPAPTATPSPEPEEEPEVIEPETPQPETITPTAVMPGVPGFLDDLQRLEDSEGVFTAYAPARLQGETSAEWEGDVYTVYHAFWAADADYEEIYPAVFLGVAGPVNQIMAGHAQLSEDDLPEPSFAVPSLDEWEASIAVYAESLALPDNAISVRYDIPGDDYGVLFYHEAVDEAFDELLDDTLDDGALDSELAPDLEDPWDDESYRMWTYITQQDGVGFIVFLLGPLEEPDIPLHADADVRFPTPIDLGLESFTWDLDAAKSAILNRLAQRYSFEELAALTMRPFSDPRGGFTMQVPPAFTHSVRTLEADTYAVGFRDPNARNGIYLRFTDLGATLSPDEWLEVLELATVEFWPFLNRDPDDPAPEILAETVATNDDGDSYNYAAYEAVGTAQHGLFEFIEIDGLFAFAVGLTDPNDWDALEDDMRYTMASIELDSDTLLANLAEHGELPAALTSVDIQEAPGSYAGTPAEDVSAEEAREELTAEDVAEAAYAPLVLYGTIMEAAAGENLALIITGPDGNPVGQIGGLLHADMGDSESLSLTEGDQGEIAMQLRFVPAAPWQPGAHVARLYYAGALLSEFGFTVTGPPVASNILPAIRDVSLAAVEGASIAASEAEGEALTFAPEATLRYRFHLRLPAADHQVRLFVYHEGELVPRLTHVWHFPLGTPDWAGRADLRLAQDWQPGDYTIHLWVNDSPWDVTTFTVQAATSPEDDETPEAQVVPLTPASGDNLALQAVLEPSDRPAYLDIAFVDQGRALATLNLGNELIIYDTTTWRERYRYASDAVAWHLAADPAGERLAISYQNSIQRGDNAHIVVWNTTTWEIEHVLYGHTDAIRAVSFDPAGQWLLSVAMDNTLRAWSLTGGLPTARFNVDMETRSLVATALDVSADGRRAALVYSDGVGEMWRVETTAGETGTATLSPLYTFDVGGQEHELRMFPASEQQDPTVGAAFDGPVMLVAGDGVVQVWTYYDQVAELAQVFEDPAAGRFVTAAPSADAQLVIAGGHHVVIVDTVSGEVLAQPDYSMIPRLEVAQTGHIALLDNDGNIHVLAPVE